MDDLMRASCLTLARRLGSTIADIVPLLTDTGFRRDLLARHGEPDGLHRYCAATTNSHPGNAPTSAAPSSPGCGRCSPAGSPATCSPARPPPST
jgi:hypothetical protein